MLLVNSLVELDLVRVKEVILIGFIGISLPFRPVGVIVSMNKV